MGSFLEFFRLALFTLFTSISAHAALGGSVNSIPKDLDALRSSGRILTTSRPSYSIHEIESELTKIREFVSQDGVIFAIAWVGNRHPEPETLLGEYQNDYQGANAETPPLKGMRSRFLKTQKLLFQTWGNPRHLQGRMLDPSRMPAGVSIDEIR